MTDDEVRFELPSTIGAASRVCGSIMDVAPTFGPLGIMKEVYALNIFANFLYDTNPEFRDFFDNIIVGKHWGN